MDRGRAGPPPPGNAGSGTVNGPVLQNVFPITAVWLFTVCTTLPLLEMKLTVPL